MKKLLILFAFITLAAGCSSGDSNGTTNSGSYDKTALLTNWADNIIIPSFENYQAKVTALNEKTTAFTTAPTEANLALLRQSWLEAYKAYQYVALFENGKAGELYLVESSNTYPADVAGINANIASGNYILTQQVQFTRQGYPALDYIINGLGTTDTAIASFYNTNANAAGYKQYLAAVVTRLKQTADAIVADWKGSYRATFISSTGTSVSGAVNITANNFVKNLEKDVRFPKMGVPAGLFSNGQTYPDKVEAYYKNDVSKELLIDAVTASRDFFNGKYFNSATTGPGLKGYLDAVGAGGNKPLSTVIDNQYALALTAAGVLNNSFSQQITTDNTKMVAAYNALQQVVIYTKSSMLSALNISIDYVDGDGD